MGGGNSVENCIYILLVLLIIYLLYQRCNKKEKLGGLAARWISNSNNAVDDANTIRSIAQARTFGQALAATGIMNRTQARNTNNYVNQNLNNQAQGQYIRQSGNFITGRGW